MKNNPLTALSLWKIDARNGKRGFYSPAEIDAQTVDNIWPILRDEYNASEGARLTLKQVRQTLSRVNVTIRKTAHGEYVVRVKGSPVGFGYFTTQLDDALATGLNAVKGGD
jgi:hypothetical protein